MTAGRRASRIAMLLGVLLVALWAPRPAAAGDTLTVIGGSNAAAFPEVLDHVAEYAGFFKDEGLTVNKQYSGSAGTAAQLVATGKADIATLSVEPMMQGYVKGLRLQLFFSRVSRYNYVLAVLSDSPIKTLADFKGADIGELNVASASELSAESMLAGAGLKKTDYAFVPIGSGTQGMSALALRKVAGASFPALELGTYEVLGNMKFRYFRHPILADVSNVGFAATPAVIESKSDALKRFCRAMVKAAILIRENPQLAARYYLTGAGLKVTDDAIATTARVIGALEDDLPGADPSSKRIGYIPPQGMAVYSKFLTDMGLVSQPVPASAVVTDRFIDYANDFDHKAFIAQIKNEH
jgi:NitT/TauT family transport system substrate-binding protein